MYVLYVHVHRSYVLRKVDNGAV